MIEYEIECYFQWDMDLIYLGMLDIQWLPIGGSTDDQISEFPGVRLADQIPQLYIKAPDP
jgi:hypothetical protein